MTGVTLHDDFVRLMMTSVTLALPMADLRFDEALRAMETRVAHFEQPRFAWR